MLLKACDRDLTKVASMYSQTPFEFDQTDAREMMKRAGLRKTTGNLVMTIDVERSFEDTPT